MNKVCGNCAAWKCSPQGRNRGGVFEGTCRRKSPVSILWTPGEISTVWPCVNADDWCREWEDINEAQN